MMQEPVKTISYILLTIIYASVSSFTGNSSGKDTKF